MYYAPSCNSTSNPFSSTKEDLLKIVAACQERTFSEEVDLLESMGGPDALLASLKTDANHGLSDEEEDFHVREAVFGSNRPPVTRMKTFVELFMEALKDFTLRILLFFSFLSIVLGVSLEKDHKELAWIEGFAIFVAVIVVATVTAVNDFQKEKQFQKLNKEADSRKMVSVFRKGVLMEIHQSEVHVGEIIQIVEGMEIPADGFVLEAAELTADESAMTGEGDPIRKDTLSEATRVRNEITREGAKNMAGAHEVPSPILMSGTRMLTGEGKCVILAVGDASCVGKINALLRSQDTEATPLQEKLEAIARDIGKFGFISALIVFTILLLRFCIDRFSEMEWDHSQHWIDLVRYFMISVTVIVVAIPEGLPLAVTLSLAYSVKKMLKDNNLVRKLQACETMGGANMICSDKTGTLTQNKMSLTHLWKGKIVHF